jgi:hypothetical protein
MAIHLKWHTFICCCCCVRSNPPQFVVSLIPATFRRRSTRPWLNDDEKHRRLGEELVACPPPPIDLLSVRVIGWTRCKFKLTARLANLGRIHLHSGVLPSINLNPKWSPYKKNDAKPRLISTCSPLPSLQLSMTKFQRGLKAGLFVARRVQGLLGLFGATLTNRFRRCGANSLKIRH